MISAHDCSGELGLHEAVTQCGSAANRELVQTGCRDYSPQVGQRLRQPNFARFEPDPIVDGVLLLAV